MTGVACRCSARTTSGEDASRHDAVTEAASAHEKGRRGGVCGRTDKTKDDNVGLAVELNGGYGDEFSGGLQAKAKWSEDEAVMASKWRRRWHTYC
jgi:hypothetical protein